MIPRRIESNLKEALGRSPSVALLGPRQVGKTTLALDIAKTISSVYLDLEDSRQRSKVKDMITFHEKNSGKLIILDEVQRLPEVFASLRGIIDDERRKGIRAGQFLFLGSASIDLLKQSSESLAGRISHIELFPIDVTEYAGKNLSKMNDLWLRGGFPESLVAASESDSMGWRLDFIKTYLERDIPQLGPRIPAETLGRFWTMLAHNQGSVLNAAHLGRNLDISGATIGNYVDLMVDLLLVRRLRPWTFNVGKRLIRSPKIYLRDSGIVHALLHIETFNDLLGHPVIGGSWEGFVLENIMSVLPPRAQSFYYGTPGGAEIDLLLEFSPNEKWAIEIKRKSSPTLSKGFYAGCEDLKPEKKFIVYSGDDTYSMGDGVMAISLYDLMHEILKKR
jgi:predicted AAA+ superfamily ATPase